MSLGFNLLGDDLRDVLDPKSGRWRGRRIVSPGFNLLGDGLRDVLDPKSER